MINGLRSYSNSKNSIIVVIGALSLFLIVIIVDTKRSSGYYDNTIHLNELDTFKIEVRVHTRNRGVLLFNGRNSINIMNLNYHKINGHAFEWDDIRAPFVLEKGLRNDTVILTKRNREYLFLMEEL